MVEMKVQGLTTDPGTHLQIVWLQSAGDDATLPILVGGTEAASIRSSLAEKAAERPLTHDLIETVFGHFGARLQEVQIVDFREGTLFAQLVLESGDGRVRFDSRPSDAIALALKYGAPIYLADEILSEAGHEISASGTGEIVQVKGVSKPERILMPKEAVKSAIDALMKEMRAGERHPKEDLRGRLKDLEASLARSVRLERYEEAARIRNQIQELEEQIQTGEER
jgi:hypothetical protein